MLWNLITDWPSDSHSSTPRRGIYLFPESDCIKFILFLTLLKKKKKHAWLLHGTLWWLQGAKSTLFMFGWQRVFSSVWHTQCAVVFGTSLHPSCPPDINSTSLLGLCCVLHVGVYVCICMRLELCTHAACSGLHILWTPAKIFSILNIT